MSRIQQLAAVVVTMFMAFVAWTYPYQRRINYNPKPPSTATGPPPVELQAPARFLWPVDESTWWVTDGPANAEQLPLPNTTDPTVITDYVSDEPLNLKHIVLGGTLPECSGDVKRYKHHLGLHSCGTIELEHSDPAVLGQRMLVTSIPEVVQNHKAGFKVMFSQGSDVLDNVTPARGYRLVLVGFEGGEVRSPEFEIRPAGSRRVSPPEAYHPDKRHRCGRMTCVRVLDDGEPSMEFVVPNATSWWVSSAANASVGSPLVLSGHFPLPIWEECTSKPTGFDGSEVLAENVRHCVRVELEHPDPAVLPKPLELRRFPEGGQMGLEGARFSGKSEVITLTTELPSSVTPAKGYRLFLRGIQGPPIMSAPFEIKRSVSKEMSFDHMDYFLEEPFSWDLWVAENIHDRFVGAPLRRIRTAVDYFLWAKARFAGPRPPLVRGRGADEDINIDWGTLKFPTADVSPYGDWYVTNPDMAKYPTSKPLYLVRGTLPPLWSRGTALLWLTHPNHTILPQPVHLTEVAWQGPKMTVHGGMGENFTRDRIPAKGYRLELHDVVGPPIISRPFEIKAWDEDEVAMNAKLRDDGKTEQQTPSASRSEFGYLLKGHQDANMGWMAQAAEDVDDGGPRVADEL